MAKPPVVVASNASNEFKEVGTYFCDGTADDVQIQAAINALSPFGKIILSDGLFTISSSILFTKPLSIEGQGKFAGNTRSGNHNGITTITLANSVNDSVFKKSPMNDTAANTHWHVELRNLQVNGNKDNQTAGHGIVCDYLDIVCDHVMVRNCKEDGFHASADYTKNEIYLLHCKGSHNNGHGAYLLAQGCVVAGPCYFGGNTLDGLRVMGGDTWLEAEVENNSRYGFQADDIGTSNLNIWAAGNYEMGIYLNGLSNSYGRLFSKWSALTGSVKAYEIGVYNVRDCNFQITAKPHAINRGGIVFGHSNIRNVWIVSSTPTETLDPPTGVVGLNFDNWGTLNLANSRFYGVVRGAIAYQFASGVTPPAGLDMTSFLRDVTLITG